MITDSYSNIEINRIAHENISCCQIVLRHEKEGLAAHADLPNRTEKNNNYKICWLISKKLHRKKPNHRLIPYTILFIFCGKHAFPNKTRKCSKNSRRAIKEKMVQTPRQKENSRQQVLKTSFTIKSKVQAGTEILHDSLKTNQTTPIREHIKTEESEPISTNTLKRPTRGFAMRPN
jgi:hypothetical protein